MSSDQARKASDRVAARGTSAKDVVMRYYSAYNAGDLEAIASLMADNVEYHDMVYAEPFKGKEQVMQFMTKVMATAPRDAHFVVEDITSGDPYKVGVMWHVELGSTVFPFSRGCSFYTINDEGQIVQARDLVEGAIKPGYAAMKALAVIAPLIRRLGPAADPSQLKNLPLAAAAVWALYIGYTSHVMLSTSAPGLPAYSTPLESLKLVLDQSFNFFYVNIALSSIGLNPVPSNAVHPVYEGLFNFVSAWGVLFLPVILTERKSAKVGYKWAWWTGIMFLTNVFFIPFLALRAAPEPTAASSSNGNESSSTIATSTTGYPAWTRAVAVSMAGIGIVSILWAVLGRPEFGGIQARLDYLQAMFASDRIFYAFILDAVLYSVWQWEMLGSVPGATTAQRAIPFFGLAHHLIVAGSSQKNDMAKDN